MLKIFKYLTDIDYFLIICTLCGVMAYSPPLLAQLVEPAAVPQDYQITTYLIPETDRLALRRFVEEARDKECEASKTRGDGQPCVTPEMAVTVFPTGSILPLDVTTVAVPADVTGRFNNLPKATAYVYVSNNVYLIEEKTRRIVDVVVLPEVKAAP